MFRGGGLARPGGLIRPMATSAAPASTSAGAGMQAPVGLNRYIMRQRVFAIGQDFFINNAAGQPVFKIDGKVRLVKESLKFRDMQGNLLYQLDERVIRIRESFEFWCAHSRSHHLYSHSEVSTSCFQLLRAVLCCAAQFDGPRSPLTPSPPIALLHPAAPSRQP